MQDLQVVKLEQEINTAVAKAESMAIGNPEQYQEGALFLKEIKTVQKNVTEYWGTLKTSAHKTWKEICGKEKDMLDPLKAVEAITKKLQLCYQNEQEQIRRKEEARRQAIEDARVEKERQKLLKEAEKLKTPELKEQRLIEADEIVANVIAVETSVPKVKGQSIRKTWKAKIVNKKAFLAAALKDENLLSFVSIDNGELNRMAGKRGGNLKYPGIEFYEEQSLSSTGW